ncbi:GntR family transcriptional regulator [Streptomyces gancidicus BKS 13-15]|uniref:GntR family transcriptional regulator n=1 Tax=Streptomyces gancidicus BKS 13-15 TaxID=1284664 RepID=M3D4F3_STREZ|nr:GntR family transcriptional regulator [Streptomyces gancidicus BKS 13-15]
MDLAAEAVMCVRRRRFLVDSKPVLLATSYLPLSLVAGSAITQEDTGPGGTYARLSELGHAPVHFRGLWRIAQVAGLPVADQVGRNGREAVVAISLTLMTEGLALLTLGLVRPWGEVAPRWLPFIGGRRMHTFAVVVPAMLGAAALCATAGWFACTQAAGLIEHVTQTPAQQLLLVVCYAPLLAWAPLLAATTLAYYRRRASVV